MRFIEKGNSPAAFDAWKGQLNENWTPTYSNFRNPEKQIVHDALLAEQGRTCCYCGRQIGLQDSHIEHLVPQEQSEALALEYNNMFASCVRQPVPPLHCGHAKDRHLDRDRYISPLDRECEERFLYNLNGNIVAAREADANAGYMIDLLKLDIAALRNRREQALAGLFDDEFISLATVEELEQIRDSYRTRGPDGSFEDFAHVIARYAEQLIDTPADAA